MSLQCVARQARTIVPTGAAAKELKERLSLESKKNISIRSSRLFPSAATLLGVSARCFGREEVSECASTSVRLPQQGRSRGWRQQVSGRRRLPGVVCSMAGAATFPSGSPPEDVWVPPSASSLGEKLLGIAFYATTFVLSIPIFAVMALLYPFVRLFDRRRRRAYHFLNKLWASCTTFPFFRVEIEGKENLPRPEEPAVYVANHQSFLDIYTLFHVARGFKFISKTSNFMIPIIGWAMYLTGHIPLKRMDKRSQLECLKECHQALKEGAPVLFFPEGTRTKDGFLSDFKKGAFSIAVKAKVPIVPISLVGTGRLMPNGMESTLRPGKVKVVIHPPLRGDNADDLAKESRAIIADTLRKNGLGVH